MFLCICIARNPGSSVEGTLRSRGRENSKIWTCLAHSQHIVTLKLQDDDTALTVACRGNDFTTVSILLKAGANPNVCNKVTIKSQCVFHQYFRSACLT